MSIHDLPPPPEQPQEEAVEEAAPAAPSHKPLVVGLVLIVAVVSTAIAIGIWVSRPGACDGKNVTSSRFGYCLTEPASWSSQTTSGTQDQLLQNDGSAVV